MEILTNLATESDELDGNPDATDGIDELFTDVEETDDDEDVVAKLTSGLKEALGFSINSSARSNFSCGGADEDEVSGNDTKGDEAWWNNPIF